MEIGAAAVPDTRIVGSSSYTPFRRQPYCPGASTETSFLKVRNGAASVPAALSLPAGDATRWQPDAAEASPGADATTNATAATIHATLRTLRMTCCVLRVSMALRSVSGAGGVPVPPWAEQAVHGSRSAGWRELRAAQK